MATVTKDQARALLETGRCRVQYTAGVLAAMGLMELSREIKMVETLADIARAEREKHMPHLSDNVMDMVIEQEANPKWQAADAELQAVNQRADSAWRQVDALVEHARACVDATELE